jgi:hypothetical protein
MIPVAISGIPFQLGVEFINLRPKAMTNTKCTIDPMQENGAI